MRPQTKHLLEQAASLLPFGAEGATLSRLPLSDRVERLLFRLPKGHMRVCVLKGVSHREARLYQECLTPEEAGSPQLLGAWRDREGQRWLFLETLPEQYVEPYRADQVRMAYQHLGALHRRYADRRLPPLPVRRPPPGARLPEGVPADVVRLLAGGPRTLLHGDFHRWNILIHRDRVRLLDWELAAVGHPAWDLLLLAPEEPGWDGVPSGDLAEVALRAYHSTGPLRHLSWPEFLQLQVTARLLTATARAERHRQRLAAAGRSGAAEVIRGYLHEEEERVTRLLRLLRDETKTPRP